MNTTDQVIKLIQTHKESNPNAYIGRFNLLIHELKRRLTLWKNEMSDKGLLVDVSRNVLIDVAEIILSTKREKINFSEILKDFPDVVLSYFDKMMLECYFDWKKHEHKIRLLGYNLPAPYDPYIELLKRGANCLKSELGNLEMLPYASTFSSLGRGRPLALPYYIDEKDLEIADENHRKEQQKYYSE